MSAHRSAADRRSTPAPSIRVGVTWGLRTRWPGVTSLLERVARHAALREGFHEGELSLAVVGARRMATLHREYCGEPGATDVLTFDLGTRVQQRLIVGDIIVCADIARRVAQRVTRKRAWRKTAIAELALYVTHGVLHLALYDDHSPLGFAQMHRREDELLTEVGIGPVFSSMAR